MEPEPSSEGGEDSLHTCKTSPARFNASKVATAAAAGLFPPPPPPGSTRVEYRTQWMTSSAGNSHAKSHESERSSSTVSGPAPGFFLFTSGLFLAVGGLVWGFCEAPGDRRDAKGCLITAAHGVFIGERSGGVGGAYSYSTRLPLEGEGGAPAWGGSHRTCFWHPATGIQPTPHIFWVSAPTSCLVVLLLITPDLPYEQIPPPSPQLSSRNKTWRQ